MRIVAQTHPGLQGILAEEAASLRMQPTGHLRLGQRNDLVLIDAPDPEQALGLRVAEDVHAVVLEKGALGETRHDLGRLEPWLRRAPMDRALELHATLTGGRGTARVTRFRVVTRIQGRTDYTRAAAGAAAAAALASRLGRNWRQRDDGAKVEFWLTLTATCTLVTLRLTDSRARHRGRVVERPGALRPAIAAAMVRLSHPRPDDVVLDPFCGTGTILVERALAGPHQLLIGSDIDAEALAAARLNLGPRHKPLELHHWDAMSLPLASASVDRIITNVPFGQRYGSRDSLRSLYPRFLSEAARVIRPHGLLVVLAPDRSSIGAKALDGWHPERSIPVLVLGRRARLIALRRARQDGE